MPLVWAGSIVTRARKEGRINDDFALKALITKLDKYRTCNGTLLNYDWVNVPLVYTQVATLAVYTFVLSTLLGRQFLDPSRGYPGHEVDFYIPVFTILQFFFYVGWLKVSEALGILSISSADNSTCRWQRHLSIPLVKMTTISK